MLINISSRLLEQNTQNVHNMKNIQKISRWLKTQKLITLALDEFFTNNFKLFRRCTLEVLYLYYSSQITSRLASQTGKSRLWGRENIQQHLWRRLQASLEVWQLTLHKTLLYSNVRRVALVLGYRVNVPFNTVYATLDRIFIANLC